MHPALEPGVSIPANHGLTSPAREGHQTLRKKEGDRDTAANGTDDGFSFATEEHVDQMNGVESKHAAGNNNLCASPSLSTPSPAPSTDGSSSSIDVSASDSCPGKPPRNC